jgi:hypothetical protein
MNERIRLLAEQAGIYKLDLSDETEYWIIEKFAELIVNKCAEIVEGFTIEQEVALDDYEEYEASAVLKEHFGVEE